MSSRARWRTRAEAGCGLGHRIARPLSPGVLWRAPWRALLGAVLGTAITGAAAAEEERYRSTDPGYPYSVYREVAEDVLDLGLIANDGRDASCFHNYYSWNPCTRSIGLWREFADRHGLAQDRISAQIFESYVRRDYRRADDLYAKAKGYELPPHGGYEGPGLEVLAFELQPDSSQERGCENNPYSEFPCRQAQEAWEAFAAKHGLPLNRQGGAVFQAYVNGDFVKGDRLYAALTGKHTQYEIVHSGIGSEILALGIGVSTSERDACDVDPFAFNPCNGALRILREFAAKHGLEVSRDTGKLLAQYADGEYERADKLYASAKGITVDELLEQRNVPRKPKDREVPRLIIDIHARAVPRAPPGQAGLMSAPRG